MHRLRRKRGRSLWASLGLAALALSAFAVRYGLVRYRLERDIEATEREQKEWVARDRAEAEALKRRMQEVIADSIRRQSLSTQRSVEARDAESPADYTTQPAAD